jgi:hypothetical protein
MFSLSLAFLLSPSGLIVSFVTNAMNLFMISLCDEKRGHDRIPGYDEVDHLFWYPEGIARIVLTGKTCLVDIPPLFH